MKKKLIAALLLGATVLPALQGCFPAVAAGVGGASPEDWPCAGAHGSEETVWYVDGAAASRLD